MELHPKAKVERAACRRAEPPLQLYCTVLYTSIVGSKRTSRELELASDLATLASRLRKTSCEASVGLQFLPRPRRNFLSPTPARKSTRKSEAKAAPKAEAKAAKVEAKAAKVEEKKGGGKKEDGKKGGKKEEKKEKKKGGGFFGKKK